MEPQIPQAASQQQQLPQPQQGQGQRYCPTPIMAPPPSSPAPSPLPGVPMQHHPQHHQPPPSISPSPHSHHPGYYSHQPQQHSYPQVPQQHAYYQGYYSHAHHHGQPSPNPPPPAQHYQQWSHTSHHGYYQQTQQAVAAPQHQVSGYPPQAQSPYPYVQHQPAPSQQHPGIPPTQQGQPLVSQQQPPQQQQSQHALMNLSRFVSQQSPCSSPVPHPHSPTTPVPMSSPHYPPPQQQVQMQQVPCQSQVTHQQQLLPQQHQHHPGTPGTPGVPVNLHQAQGNYSTPLSPPMKSHPNPLPSIPANANLNAISNHNQLINNATSSRTDQVQNSLIINHDMSSANVNNFPMGIPNEGRSGSSSPSGFGSSRPLSSPPATSSSSGASNGQMMLPVGQNMQKRARTKASMRKLMQEQHNTYQQETSYEGPPSSDHDTESESRPETSSKKSVKTPRTPKKGKKGAKEGEKSAHCSTETKTKSELGFSTKGGDNPENQIQPGYTKKGKKIGRPPKPKPPIPDDPPPPKKKGRKPKKSLIAGESVSQNEQPRNLQTPTPTGKKSEENVIVKSIESTSSQDTINTNEDSKSRSLKSPTPSAKDNTEDVKARKLKSPTPSPNKADLEDLKGRNLTSPTNSVKEVSEMSKSLRTKSPTKEAKDAEEDTKAKSIKPTMSPSKEPLMKESAETKHSPPVPAAVSDIDEKTKTPEVKASKSSKKKSSTVSSKRGRKPKTGAKNSESKEDDWELSHVTTGSESEQELVEISKTPTGRPLRTRASKGPSKVEEVKAPAERSRKARPRRSSRSYKESSMSTSRSKSPKDLSPLKKSRKGASPPKASPKEQQKVTPSKSSPRLKAASPSPVRVRQLKDQIPIENKRETRSSKEREETPTRGLRGRGKAKSTEKGKTDLPSDESPSRRKSTKQLKDTTPGRLSSPRLAKEKKGEAAKAAVKTRGSVDQEPAPKTAKTSGRVTRGKSVSKEIVEKVDKSRKRKMSPDISEERESVVKTKKGKVTTSTKKRKGKGRKSIEEAEAKEQSNESNEDAAMSTDLQTSLDTSGESATTATSETPNVSLTSTENESSNLNSSLEVETPQKSKEEPESKSKTVQRRASVLDGRGRSKSPRQSGENINAALLAQCSNSPVVLIPPLPTSMSTKEKFRYVEPVSAMPTPSIPVPPVTFPQPPITTTVAPQSVSVPQTHLQPLVPEIKVDTPSVQSVANEEPKSQTLSTADKPKKPRKPKTPKDKTPKVVEKPEIDIGSKKKQGKVEPPQIPLHQGKDSLEVEVAQLLLEMKHSSKSPSPVKAIMEAIPTPMMTPPSAQAKPRKRKSTGSAGIVESQPQPNGDMVSPMVVNLTDMNAVVGSINAQVEKAALIKGRRPSGKQKQKKQRLSTETESFATSTPTILAVPQVNGNQATFPSNSSISFQNTPVKVPGPVKVSKTVLIPGKDAPLPLSSPSSVDDTIARVAANLIQSSYDEKKPEVKQKKKKTVVPKALNPTAVPEDQSPGVKTKRKYTRKKSKDLNKSADNQQDTLGVPVTPNSNSSLINGAVVTPTIMQGMSQTSGTPSLSPFSPEKGAVVTGSPSKSPPKKRRKSSVVKPEPFALNPKPVPAPTVFVKSPPLATVKTVAGTSTDGKERSRAAPTLKVVRGRTKFYRGSDEEELDAEPQLSKRGAMQFDPDVPWLCCFCNLGPHAQKLGDLFGPYYTEQTVTTGKTKTAAKRETWMHQDCALWGGSTVLIGSKLHGLEETLSHSNEDTCTTCGKKGATIGCLKRGCKQAVHYPCAIRKSWKLDEETFHSFCPAHIA